MSGSSPPLSCTLFTSYLFSTICEFSQREKQVDDILGKMAEKQFKTVSDYLNTCYEDGFVGTMFDLQGQGIPLCFPLDQESMIRAVQLDSPISSGLYNHLGENVNELKQRKSLLCRMTIILKDILLNFPDILRGMI